MVGFVCEKCGYSFESGTNSEGKKCPYCGEGKIKKFPSAEELVEDD